MKDSDGSVYTGATAVRSSAARLGTGFVVRRGVDVWDAAWKGVDYVARPIQARLGPLAACVCG